MPHTIAENLTRLSNARDAIAAAIVDKGGTIEAGDGFESFADKIEAISGGGGVLISKNITENGTYYAVDDEADGYSSVTVNIQQLPVNFLKYIKSEGNSIILTDIVPNYNWEAHVCAMFDNPNTGGDDIFFGVRYPTEHFLMAISRYGTNSTDFVGWSGFTVTSGDVFDVPNIADNELGIPNICILRRGNGKCMYGSKSYTMTNRTDDTTPTIPIMIAGFDDEGTVTPFTQFDLTIYGVKLYDGNGTLVHNLVPAQAKVGGRAGLYDIITGIFYPSDSNYDDFIKGIN